MELGKYIQTLLLENDTVIVPGFGAFVSTYKPAEFTEGQLLPPAKTIDFNEQIRNNDGLLVNAIAEGEQISQFDAFRLMEKETEEIRYQLDKGNTARLDPIGSFLVNTEGNMSFLVSESIDNLLLDSFGMERIEVELKPHGGQEKIGVVGQVTGNADDIEPQMPEEEMPEEEEEEKRRRKGGFWWIFIIIIPLLLAGGYVGYQKWISRDNVPVQTIQVKTEPADLTSLVVDTVNRDSVQKAAEIGIAEVDSTRIKEEQPMQEDSIPKYYLIGGSFKVEENAVEYFGQLEKEGFKPFRLGKFGNFFIVGIGTYDTEEEALLAKEKHEKENPNSGVWVLKK